MFKSLLTATALSSILLTSAFAQTATTNPAPADGKVMQPSVMFDRNAAAGTDTNGYFEAMSGQVLASKIIGQAVYAGSGDNAERIGEVNDIILGANGTGEAVLLGVGGFLGMGEKDIAIDFDRLNWVSRNGDNWLTVEAGKAELEGAPAYDRAKLQSAAQTMPIDGATAPSAVATNQGGIEAATPDTMVDKSATAATKETYQTVDRGTLSTKDLIGTRVYGPDDKDLGEISEVIVSTDGAVEAYIVDVGGFLGMSEKPVAIDAAQLEVLRASNGSMIIRTPFTQERLEAQVTYEAKGYKANRDTMIMR